MKNFITFLNVGIVLGLAALFSGRSNPTGNTKKEDSIKLETSVIKLENRDASFMNSITIGDEVVNFLMEVSEARIMDLEEGRIAQQRATFRTLKDYGTLMVNDQTKMLKELEAIATSRKIRIPQTLGQSKANDLSDLKREHGKEFDSKFIKMIVIDHKRDVKKFRKALYSDDPDIQVFATKYLPVVESHLDKIQSIKKTD